MCGLNLPIPCSLALGSYICFMVFGTNVPNKGFFRRIKSICPLYLYFPNKAQTTVFDIVYLCSISTDFILFLYPQKAATQIQQIQIP